MRSRIGTALVMVTAVAVGLVGIAACGGSTDRDRGASGSTMGTAGSPGSAAGRTVGTTAGAVDAPQFLLTIGASGGVIDGTTLTLTDLDDEVLYFGDRPSRVAFRQPVGVAFDWWVPSFGDVPPNAALVFVEAGHDRSVGVELRQPRFDAAARTATFAFAVLPGPTGEPAMPVPNGSLIEPRLFVDGMQFGFGGECGNNMLLSVQGNVSCDLALAVIDTVGLTFDLGGVRWSCLYGMTDGSKSCTSSLGSVYLAAPPMTSLPPMQGPVIQPPISMSPF